MAVIDFLNNVSVRTGAFSSLRGGSHAVLELEKDVAEGNILSITLNFHSAPMIIGTKGRGYAIGGAQGVQLDRDPTYHIQDGCEISFEVPDWSGPVKYTRPDGFHRHGGYDYPSREAVEHLVRLVGGNPTIVLYQEREDEAPEWATSLATEVRTRPLQGLFGSCGDWWKVQS